MKLNTDIRIARVDDYEEFVGAETIDRIRQKARPLRDIHVANINATYYGGGVAGMLSSFIVLLN